MINIDTTNITEIAANSFAALPDERQQVLVKNW
jgi:hypothetical protein